MDARSISELAISDPSDPLALFGLDAREEVVAILGDMPRIREALIEAARVGESVSYSAILLELGLRFSRPKMRSLCVTMGAIDRAGVVVGEPGLAVLVVRESDRLPGQGWCTHAAEQGHVGDCTGPAARALVTKLQARAIRYWRDRD
ncbi:MAG: hypothetical protein ACRYFW_03530 [Janthinobacterium lividum]